MAVRLPSPADLGSEHGGMRRTGRKTMESSEDAPNANQRDSGTIANGLDTSGDSGV